MIVQPLDLEGQPQGDAFLALDTVQAGSGDRVLVLREGGSARIIFDDKEIPVQAVITAVIDGIQMDETQKNNNKQKV